MKGHIQLLKHGKEVSLLNFADRFQFEKRVDELKAHAAITFEHHTGFEIVATVTDSDVNGAKK